MHRSFRHTSKLKTAVRNRMEKSNTFRNLRRVTRRLFHAIHDAQGGYRMGGAVAFLVMSGSVATALVLTTLYTPSYAVVVDGETMGIVPSQEEISTMVTRVEDQGTALLGYDYNVNSEIEYQFGLTRNENVGDTSTVETYLYSQLEDVGASLRKYQLKVDGKVIGVVEDSAELVQMLAAIRSAYHSENTVSSSFVEKVEIVPVYQTSGLTNLTELFDTLTANTTGKTTYTVESGDTFNAIAYRNDMSSTDLQNLNPDVNINKLSIGDTLNVKEIIPFLSVQTVESMTYEAPIACPVKEVDDNSIYVGSSKVVVQGEEGLAQVQANVSYVNGYEMDREIIQSTTLREPTTTTVAIGTLPRPKTASYGKYHWPVSGRVTSYFGGRYIFGSYSYHSGIDISASYGTPIKAADGGTVTFSGYNGSYGYLVIITHDNGNQTYYAHNSSLLVSTGDKVYRGETIAKAGSTGRSTGNHCHFEIRVNGSAVNPLSYLP